MRIGIFSQIVRKVSGLYTFELNFIKEFHKEHEIVFIHQGGHEPNLKELSQYCDVVQDTGQIIEVDLLIYSSLIHGDHPHNLKAKKKIQMCHTDFKAWNVDYKKPAYIDELISVGNGVQNSLKEHFGLDSILIPNILNHDPLNPVLRLITASRIAEGKGFNRIVKLAKILKLSGRPFAWEIYGDGIPSFIEDLKYQLNAIPEVVFMGHRNNMKNYICKSDYLVQLSDNEGFCYSVHEALQLGIPCLCTDFAEGVIIPGVNGYLIDSDVTNVNVNDIFDKIPRKFKYNANNAIKEWKNLFNLTK